MKGNLFSLAILFLFIISMIGCTTTIMFEDQYDVRIVNRTGDTIKVKFDDGSYRRIDKDEVLIISSVNFGYHKITYEWESKSGRNAYKEVYEFSIDADFEIVIKDDTENSIIIIEY